MLTTLKDQKIDIAILPINRGQSLSVSKRKSLVTCGRVGGPISRVALDVKLLIGCHNDLFNGNRVNPGMLFDELDKRAPWQRCHLLQPSELYLYAG